MRAKRAKKYRKLMHQYELAFDFREPYQVLMDAQIIIDAAKFKMRLGSLLENTVGGSIKPMITQCCIRHLYDSPANTEAEKREKDGWIAVAKQAERRRCGHHELEQPLSTLECLESAVDPKSSGTNKHRYVVASQDQRVRAKMRTIAGVPLVYINRSVMILEPMASATADVREREERAKVRAGLKGRRGAETGVKRKRELDEDQEAGPGAESASAEAEDAAASKKKRVKGTKGPNPLSMKKAKKEKPKTTARQVEDERSVFRKAAKKDPQAADKAIDANLAVEGAGTDGVTDGLRKRKRKRKPKDSTETTMAGDGGEED